MTETSWAQQEINRFFSSRKSPSQMQCDKIAHSISGASTVRPVESPGDLVISFREAGAMLDEGMVKLAKQIHSDLVPESTAHGNVDGTNPPLIIYSMPYCKVQTGPDEIAKHGVFIKDLARYFGRCWSSSQSGDCKTQAEQQEGIRKRLIRLVEEPTSSILSTSTLAKLIENLPSLFSQDYPQVLTHGDFSVTNILVDENKYGITGIVDWSLTAIMPFGMDLHILYLTTGFLTRDGWYDYACKPLLRDVFWDEFWAVSGIVGEGHRSRTQDLAEAAAKISAILRLVFRRNTDGSPSEEISVSESSKIQLTAWFGEGAAKPS
ncbi:hypothetical protein BJ170DRAFT_709363 [Xylariales sp. AK1849]|nr:hypothetical protein BJ170DRAFT_709363 [Xylariales sp. AK1849]